MKKIHILSRQITGKLSKYFPGLSRTDKQNSRTFQNSKKNQRLSRTFPGCGNPGHCFESLIILAATMLRVSERPSRLTDYEARFDAFRKHRSIRQDGHSKFQVPQCFSRSPAAMNVAGCQQHSSADRNSAVATWLTSHNGKRGEVNPLQFRRWVFENLLVMIS